MAKKRTAPIRAYGRRLQKAEDRKVRKVTKKNNRRVKRAVRSGNPKRIAKAERKSERRLQYALDSTKPITAIKDVSRAHKVGMIAFTAHRIYTTKKKGGRSNGRSRQRQIPPVL